MSRLKHFAEKLESFLPKDQYVFISLALAAVPMFFISDFAYSCENLSSLEFWFDEFYKQGYIFLFSYCFLSVLLKKHTTINAVLSFVVSFIVDNILQLEFSFTDKSVGFIVLVAFIELFLLLAIFICYFNKRVLAISDGIQDEQKKNRITMLWLSFKLLVKVTLMVLLLIACFVAI